MIIEKGSEIFMFWNPLRHKPRNALFDPVEDNSDLPFFIRLFRLKFLLDLFR